MVLRAFLYLCILLPLTALGQYDSNDIPDDLKRNAVAVVRSDIGNYTILNEKEAVLHVHMIVTVLTPSGKGHAEFALPYNDDSSVEDIKATVYDKNGKKVRTIKKGDIQDISAGGSFMTDGRYKYIDLKYQSYPYTVEISYTERSQQLLFYENWYIQPSSNVSVQHSSFSVNVPTGIDLRYKEINLPNSVEIENDEQWKKYKWSFDDIKILETEPYIKSRLSLMPVVLLGPTKFSMGGYKGDMSDWEGLSSWYYNLNKGRDALPEPAAEAVRTEVQGISDKRERIKRVYEYMQSKTRYVSVQLGIGGWQTLEASHVDQYGWGDCKALTNYTKALLKSVDIPSYEALVKAGATISPIEDDFPTSQFNHVILAVPVESDTVWLECTSQTDPFNYLGSFTGNRKVLIVNEEGGALVNSQQFRAEDNLELNRAEISLDENGSAKAIINTVLTGMEYTRLILSLLSEIP